MKIERKNISIEEFDDVKFLVELFEPYEENKAIITHYLTNYYNEESKVFEKDALKIINSYVNKKNGDEDILVAEESAIQKLMFEMDNVPFPTKSSSFFTFIDLFAGIGGFRLALQNVGGKCIYSSEWNNDAKITYKVNFGDIPFGDITKTYIKKYIPNNFDVLCAGFPCQAFSIAGNRKGFADTRGTLFFDIEEIVKKHRPKVVFLENVKNLVTHDRGNTFTTIINTLEKKLQYKTFTRVLNTMTHGNIPQNRERIFIIAFDPIQVPNYINFEFPKPIKLNKTIHDIIEKDKQDDKYYYKQDHPYYPELEKTINNSNTIYQWRRIYVRENKNNVCPTLTANMGTGGHNVPIIKDSFGIRKLTPRECFSFQGYPDNYILPAISNSKLYMQAGNSVTTTLIERISKEIIKVL